MSFRSVTLRLQRTAILLAAVLTPSIVGAQVTPAAGYTPPDNTPAIKVGATIFADYTYTKSPTSVDVDTNTFKPQAFNVARAYINITGNISHVVSFRITPDISRETGAGASLSGSLEYRLKYAFAQVSLQDWVPSWMPGAWLRFGQQQTPWVDYTEGVYRYRFQGTVFSEREGFLSSSDVGASFHTNFPSNFGEIHVGLYNGETYSKAETNDQKALQARVTLRPFATMDPMLRGLKATLFYDGDDYVKNGERTRSIGALSYEMSMLTVGAEALSTADQTQRSKPDVKGKGWSVWATPRMSNGLEALVRLDNMEPNTSAATSAQLRKRTIVGVAYWFPHEGSVSSAIMLDFDNATFTNFTPAQKDQTKIALHALVNF